MLENLQNIIRQNTAQKDLPEHVFIDAIEEVLKSAAQKVYGEDADISIEINLEAGHIGCYVPKKVVNITRDFLTEISIEQAQQIKKDVALGDMITVEIKPSDLGRIQAQYVKQTFSQKIKQAEREKIYQQFAGREGEVVTAYVQRPPERRDGGYYRGNYYLELEQTQTEALLPGKEVPRGHEYPRSKRLQCLIVEVRLDMRDPVLILSRTHDDLIAVLFEQEVPEIYEGQVQIMAVARDPGNRAKVAVRATEEGIDAVGTCVGVKGIRVQTVVAELDEEKIDLLEWNEDPTVFIANALGGRVDVRRVELNEVEQSALVVVPDNQLSLAIGQRGQNARLAARLTGWKVDIKGESEAIAPIDELFMPLAEEADTVDEEAPAPEMTNTTDTTDTVDITGEIDEDAPDAAEDPETEAPDESR